MKQMNDIDKAKEFIVEKYRIRERWPKEDPKAERAETNANQIDRWQNECAQNYLPRLKAQLVEELVK